ncbi:hypothetical protein [Dactylosporangium sp. NPDC051541]|uniref:hypothetical protein n=1 Tax=Dactylosporangium sp. NPDC051541 TaxID=3363977 RepID=UPI00378BDCF5
MLAAGTCRYPPLDIAATSASYAQMTGLLAGVAFTALVLLLTPAQNQLRGRTAPADPAAGGASGRHSAPLRADSQVLLALFAAFVAFLFATLSYSILAGDRAAAAAARIASEEVIDGISFGLAFVTLFHGLALLLDAARIDPTMVWVARILAAVVLPSISMFYIVNAVPDVEMARAELAQSCPSGDMYLFGLALTVVCLLTLTAALVAHVLGRWPGRRSSGRAVPISVLTASILATAVAGDISSRSQEFLVSRFWLMVLLLVMLVLFTGMGLLLITSWPTESPLSVTVVLSRSPRRDVAMPRPPLIPRHRDSGRPEAPTRW